MAEVTFDANATKQALKEYGQSLRHKDHLFLKIKENKGVSYLKAERLTFWDKLFSLFGFNQNIRLDNIVKYLSAKNFSVPDQEAFNGLSKINILYKTKHKGENNPAVLENIQMLEAHVIPNYIEKADALIELFKKHKESLESEGIFRKSPGKKVADQVIDDLRVGSSSAHSIINESLSYALALKKFILEIDFVDSIFFKAIEEEKINTQDLNAIAEKIDPLKRPLFIKLVEFLREVSKINLEANPPKTSENGTVEHTHMSPKAIAVVFGPNMTKDPHLATKMAPILEELISAQ